MEKVKIPSFDPNLSTYAYLPFYVDIWCISKIHAYNMEIQYTYIFATKWKTLPLLQQTLHISPTLFDMPGAFPTHAYKWKSKYLLHIMEIKHICYLITFPLHSMNNSNRGIDQALYQHLPLYGSVWYGRPHEFNGGVLEISDCDL